MKILKVVSLFSFVVLFFMYCTKTDQVVVSTTAKNTTDLLAFKTATAPTIDGVVDLMWANAEKLDFIPGVPDPGNGLFAGYIGETFPTSLRAMYDNEYIYFLAEYADKDQSQKVAPWYFNPTTQLWAKEGTSRTYDANGVLIREGYGEDKIAIVRCQRKWTI